MRKVILVSAMLVSLIVAGLAVARGFDGTASAAAVTGTFTATTAANVETRTCTTSDSKTIEVTSATYTGTGAGAAGLTGPIKLRVRSLINTTDGVGVVSGAFSIDTAADKNTSAAFSAVYDHGKLAGLASGRTQDHSVGLLANLSSGYTAAGGFTDGKIGATAGGSAVLLGPGKCESVKKESSSARGAVSAVSATSITVAGLTCTVPASFATQIAAIKVGDQLQIQCTLVSATNTLAKLGGGEHNGDNNEKRKR